MNFGGIFDVAGKQTRLEELDESMASPDFWNDQNAALATIRESRQLKQWTEPWTECSDRVDGTLELLELFEGEDDDGIGSEIEAELQAAEADVEELEFRNMLSGEDAHRSAILTINPGAGGTESMDWAQMLFRMYTRWAEASQYGVEVMDLLPGEEAGVKSATLEISGKFAYGYLSAERGVHRLVRISPFDSQHRRHTSFASVFVYPVVDDDIEIEINEEDLRIDTYRASGAGGQHVNKTDSAVRITHEPTGIVVSCQQERSQHKNKSKALRMLQAALYQAAVEEREAEREKLEGTKTKIEWGQQIRSYVLQPYKMVKDHRTGTEMGNVDAVLDGRLDPFIRSFLQRAGGGKGT